LELDAETLHQVTIIMSDRGIPASFRNMHGFGSHTFSFINVEGERFFAVEEDGSVVPDKIPVSILGIELHREPANIALGLGGAAFPRDG
jgi:hypothetical protein